MKKILIIVLMTLSYFILNAQYRKMPLDTNHVWQEHCNYSNPPFNISNSQLIKVKKDSIINGKTYKYLAAYNLQCSGAGTYVFLREDTILKRVILYNGQERILYNFNKNVGDTANLFCPVNGVTTYTLLNKDSVLINDGFYHKRFNFFGTGPGNVIEGVGALNGLLMPYCVGFDTYTSLECLSRISPSLTIYSSGGINSTCPAITTSIPKNSENEKTLSIFPNPSSELINLSTGYLLPTSIEITNIIGQTVLTINKINSVNTTINLNELIKGLYFVHVKFSDKTVSGHFIKN